MEESSNTFLKKTLLEDLLDFSGKVYKICLGFARNPWEAEELMQEVYLKVMKNLNSLHDTEKKREWLFRIARNTCLNHCRRERLYKNLLFRFAGFHNDHPSPERHLMRNEQYRIFKRSVHNLPLKMKEVFVLYTYGHLSYSEIADFLGIKEGTVRSRLNRSRRDILTSLKGEHHEKPDKKGS
ncbi:MAG: sigma-70 family RNA polymerase sigma factor [Candidatus Aminicenantes bacterium]|nr:sigma-70 family RNA polymerase sigma factor [Candidatus Aminicenantes bacterium]